MTSPVESGLLRPLPASTAHKLSSGQVITSVSAAVKELLENALDAQAGAIEVRLDNFGLDKIAVQDDGHGMDRDSMAMAAAKHCTSKIRDFEDLSNLASFGFRGEALSSCCELAEMEVASKREEDRVGNRATFNHEGNVLDMRAVPMKRGTTVTLSNIFAKLPVRRKV